MTVASLSTTACTDIDMNQLGLLKEKGSIDNYELSADKTTVTLYWTYLKKGESKTVDLIFVKNFANSSAGICQRRASQAYLYYQDEDKVWIKEDGAANAQCEIEVFDYTKPRETVPDPTKPIRPPEPPIFVMRADGAMEMQEPRFAAFAFGADEERAMAMWDAAPMV